MTLLHRATSGLLIILLALTACRKKDEGPEAAREGAGITEKGRIETKAVAGDLPGGAAVVISFYDLESFWTRLKATQFYTQLRAIPEVQRVLDPTQNPDLAEGLQGFQATLGVPFNEQTLFRTLGKKIQVGLYPKAASAATPSAADAGAAEAAGGTSLQTAGGATVDQRLVIVSEMGDKDAMASILNNLRTKAQAEGANFAQEKYKGVDVTVVSDPGGMVRGLYAFHKDKLVASTDQAGLQSAVDALDGNGGSMQADSLYQRGLKHVGEANLTLFIRKSGFKDMMQGMMGAAGGAGDQQAMIDATDKYNIQRATVVGAGWSNEGLQVRSYSLLDPGAAGAAPLLDMLKTPPSSVEVVGYFPDSTLGFYAVNFLDAPKIYDFAMGYMKDLARAAQADEQAAAQIDQGIAEFQAASGMDIRTDILGWMGREVAIGVNGVVKGGFFPVPELSIVIQSTDQARTKAFFDKLEAKLTETMQQSPQGFPLQFQEEDYKGVKLRYAPTPMGEGLAPGYALHEDYAIITLSRNTLKRMLDVKTGAVPNVSANAQFKTMAGFYPREANVFGFLNTAQLLTEVSSVLTTFQQMGQQPPPETQDTMTKAIAALRNIQAVGAYGLNDAGGIEQRFLVKIQ
jgi:hypothetical protein